jgi:hypothetical protein
VPLDRKKHPLYGTWINMRSRCNTPTCPDYPLYGGRGIRVCSRWDDFYAFVEDMGERPEAHTLDRIDTNGNYEPKNCRWANATTQSRNSRTKHNCSTGVRGVNPHTDGGYVARIYSGGKRVYLGYFKTLSEAKQARSKAEKELGWFS